MKIVLDTNVFIAGVFFGGPPRQILQAWSCGRVQLVMSTEILYEYSRVGEELCKQFPSVDFNPILELVSLNAEIVSPADPAKPICGDPDDDKFFCKRLSANLHRGKMSLPPKKIFSTFDGNSCLTWKSLACSWENLCAAGVIDKRRMESVDSMANDVVKGLRHVTA